MGKFCILVARFFFVMKNLGLLSFCLGLIWMVSCNQNGGHVKIYHGEKFDTTGVISTEQLLETLAQKGKVENVIVSGTIDKSCKHTGCWLTLKNNKGKEVLVTYKDEAFTTAKDIEGRKVTAKGNVGINPEDSTGYQFVASGIILN